MDEKKIFGIGAVVILLLMAMSPLVSSYKINTNNVKTNIEKNIQPQTYGNDCDLEIIVNNCYLENIILTGKWNDPAITRYKLNYKIKNHGEPYSGDVKVDFETMDILFNSFQHNNIINVNLDTSESKDITDSIPSYCNWDPDIDKERNLAGKIFKLEIDPLNGDDTNQNNNIDYGEVKFWFDRMQYQPTISETLVASPHNYRNISLGNSGLWYYDLPFSPEEYPDILKNNRLGYIWELGVFIFEFNKIIKEIIVDFTEFAISVTDDVTIILYWLDEVITWMASIVNGDPITFGLFQLLINFVTFVNPAIDRMKSEAQVWGEQELVDIIIDFCNYLIKFDKWVNSKPWENPITVKVKVKTRSEDDIITVYCRGETKGGTGKKVYDFTLEVPPLIEGEKNPWTIKDCTVKVFSDKEQKSIHSWKIFSWAFANGTLRVLGGIDFTSKEKTKENMNSNFENFPLLVKTLNKNHIFKSAFVKLFYTLSEKILEKLKKIESKTSKNINNYRDFDLDLLIKKARAEENQYEKYNIEYKKYYKDAPSEPNIVYYSPDQVIVGFKEYVDITEIDEVEGYPVVDWIVELNTVVVEIYAIDPEEFIDIVKQNGDVEYAELNYVYETCFIPNDPLWENQWGLKAIKCPQAWDIERGDIFEADVAILDTGCNDEHEDFHPSNSYLDYDFVNNDDNPNDDNWYNHGTHCAGIIKATQNNNKGIAGIANIFMHYGKVLDSQGMGYSSNIAKAIVHMAGGVDVISMSLGGYGLSLLVHLACDYAYYIKSTLIVAAAGNDELPILCYPARFRSVISVGAVDENLNLCSWSNHGPNLDLVAPGENIISTIWYDEYAIYSGTSMATPHVAGVIALYICQNPNCLKTNCKAKLFGTAKYLGPQCGHGLVCAYDMIKVKNKNLQKIFKILPKSLQFPEILL